VIWGKGGVGGRVSGEDRLLRCTSSLSYVFFNLPLISYPIPFPKENGRIPPAEIRRARKILRGGGEGWEKTYYNTSGPF